MIPANIISDTPLPIPNSETISPSHIKNTDPAVITIRFTIISMLVIELDITPCVFNRERKAKPCSKANGTDNSLE